MKKRFTNPECMQRIHLYTHFLRKCSNIVALNRKTNVTGNMIFCSRILIDVAGESPPPFILRRKRIMYKNTNRIVLVEYSTLRMQRPPRGACSRIKDFSSFFESSVSIRQIGAFDLFDGFCELLLSSIRILQHLEPSIQGRPHFAEQVLRVYLALFYGA